MSCTRASLWGELPVLHKRGHGERGPTLARAEIYCTIERKLPYYSNVFLMQKPRPKWFEICSMKEVNALLILCNNDETAFATVPCARLPLFNLDIFNDQKWPKRLANLYFGHFAHIKMIWNQLLKSPWIRPLFTLKTEFFYFSININDQFCLKIWSLSNL